MKTLADVTPVVGTGAASDGVGTGAASDGAVTSHQPLALHKHHLVYPSQQPSEVVYYYFQFIHKETETPDSVAETVSDSQGLSP